MRTIVDTVPTALLVLLVVGGVVGTVLLGALAVRRFVPATREGFDAEVSSHDDSVRRLNVVLDSRRDRLLASADSDLPLVIVH